MRILFRTEAASRIGAGHAMRCLALAQACRDSRMEVCFAMNEMLPAITARLDAEPIEVARVVAQPGSAQDAEETATLARERECAWVVVDGYVFGADFQARLKEAGLRVLVIDDYGHATDYCADIVLNQNIYAAAMLYPRRSATTRLLLGTRYVLLRREFARWKNGKRDVPLRAKKILVTFGGSDPVNATAKAVEALRAVPDQDLEILALTTRDFHEPRLRVLASASDPDEWMAWADLAVSAAGTTSWELAYMRTPQIVMPIAENQRAVAQGLAAQGLAVDAGWHAEVTAEQLREKIVALIPDAEGRRRLAEAGRQAVDGGGAGRVLLHLRSKGLRLRRATEADRQMLWEWANAAEVRAVSFSSAPIPWEDHCRWFDGRLVSPHCQLFIIEAACGQPAGQLRFDIDGPDAVVSTSLVREFRGMGYGSAALLLAGQRLFQQSAAQTIHAYIKPDNAASLRAFLRAGYERVADKGQAAHLVWHRASFIEHEAA